MYHIFDFRKYKVVLAEQSSYKVFENRLKRLQKSISYLKNSLIIYEQNTKEIIDTRRFSQDFCLDFLGLYNMYIENFHLHKLRTRVENGSFLKLFEILAIRALSNITPTCSHF